MMIGLRAFVYRTKLGKAMRATAQDREAAQLMGIDINTTIALTFLIGSALAGAAGFVSGVYYGSTWFFNGFSAGLKAFTAAVLGGIGNLAGAMLGGFLIGLIEALTTQLISDQWSNVVVFSVLVLVLDLPPVGFARRIAAGQGLMRAATAGASLFGVRSCLPLIFSQRRLRQLSRRRRRVRAARARLEHRGRLRRTARPRLCGVFRDRVVHVRDAGEPAVRHPHSVLGAAVRRFGRGGAVRHFARRADVAVARRLSGDRDPRLRRDRPADVPQPLAVDRRTQRHRFARSAGRSSATGSASRRCRTTT